MTMYNVYAELKRKQGILITQPYTIDSWADVFSIRHITPTKRSIQIAVDFTVGTKKLKISESFLKKITAHSSA
jgi:hypothetical protein